MKQIPVLFILYFCPCPEMWAQADTIRTGLLEVYFVPQVWLDANPRLRAGMEYHVQNKRSYSLEIGIGNQHLNHERLEDVRWGNAYSFFEIRPEVKWFGKSKSILFWPNNQFYTLPWYFALETYFQEMHDQRVNDDFNPRHLERDIGYDEADFKKIKIGMNLKTGTKYIIANTLVIDVYSGIGIAYRKINYTRVVNPIPLEDDTSEWGFFPEPYKNAGAYYLLQFSLGIRVGYVFGAKEKQRKEEKL